MKSLANFTLKTPTPKGSRVCCDINNGQVGNDDYKLLLKDLIVKKSISGKFSVFCCFWIEMLDRKAEIEKQHVKEQVLAFQRKFHLSTGFIAST